MKSPIVLACILGYIEANNGSEVRDGLYFSKATKPPEYFQILSGSCAKY